jgi:hypothetical protein
MPSPFPGMDPYLESPSRWGGVHARLIAVLGEVLTRAIAPRFFVESEYRITVLHPDDPGYRSIRPDIAVVEPAEVMVEVGRWGGGVAEPAFVPLPRPIEVRTPFLTVLDTADRRVVAVIEVVSPINKLPGSNGHADFHRKRREVMASEVHWLEIDLLRAGTRPPEVRGRGDYYALLHRAGEEAVAEVWFMASRQPLPTIAVPLLPSFADAPLDLQAVVATVYDRFRYDLVLDHGAPPPAPPLSEADATWVAECVARARGGVGDER